MCLPVASENTHMRSANPDTRNTLITLLPNQGNQDAWRQFVAIYAPLIYRLARLKGFQDVDPRELVQDATISVT